MLVKREVRSWRLAGILPSNDYLLFDEPSPDFAAAATDLSVSVGFGPLVLVSAVRTLGLLFPHDGSDPLLVTGLLASGHL